MVFFTMFSMQIKSFIHSQHQDIDQETLRLHPEREKWLEEELEKEWCLLTVSQCY